MTLGRFKADLHVHTCLSPCADLSMGPRAIVAKAAERGLDLVGISDHNSAENASAVMEAARGRSLKVLPGMEVTSREEVHVLAIFDRIDSALRMQEIVYEHLQGENDAAAFGLQVVVDADDNVLGFNNKLLAGATELPVERVVECIHRLDGLAIASHADREAFGIIGHLGFIPPELALDALEISRNTTIEEARRRYPDCGGRAMLRASDAHSIEDIGSSVTWFSMAAATVAEIRKALQGVEGRRLVAEEARVLADTGPAFG